MRKEKSGFSIGYLTNEIHSMEANESLHLPSIVNNLDTKNGIVGIEHSATQQSSK